MVFADSSPLHGRSFNQFVSQARRQGTDVADRQSRSLYRQVDEV